MKYLSVCSGIEAATVAWHHLGWEPVGFSEIEPFPSAVLHHHYPSVPNLGDMTKFKSWNLNESDVSLLVGGTPCQSFSVAGLRKGMSDDRGNLALTFCEMADHFDPEYVLWENVPGVLSSKDNAFGCLLAGLCGESEPIDPNGKWDSAGVVSGPKRTIAWRVLDAQYFGVAQRRRRVFVLAVRGAGNWAAARALFPVGESVFWDSAPSREKGKGIASVAGTLAANGGGLTRPAGNCNELDFCVPVVPSLTASGRGVERTGESRGQDPVVAVCPTLRAGGNNTGGDRPPGTDVDTVDSLIVMVHGQANAEICDDGRTPALTCNHEAPIAFYPTNRQPEFGNYSDVSPAVKVGSGGTSGNPPAVAVRTANTGANGCGISEELSYTLDRAQGQAVAFGGDIARTLQARHDSSPCADRGMDVVAVAFAQNQLGEVRTGDVTNTLNTNSNASGRNTPMIQTEMQVRWLTPTECERLQGFPDGYTMIPWRGKPADDCPDGPRYKALGNSMAVPVMRWIGNRIKRIETI